MLAPNGDAVSVTSTINNVFGARLRSARTGIILNDEMDDFSTPGKSNSYGVPASPANFIEPGKRPLSSMCPIVIVDEHGDVRMLIGGAGGIKITSSVAFVSTRRTGPELRVDVYTLCICSRSHRRSSTTGTSMRHCRRRWTTDGCTTS